LSTPCHFVERYDKPANRFLTNPRQPDTFTAPASIPGTGKGLVGWQRR
jgi:hypothetical protein